MSQQGEHWPDHSANDSFSLCKVPLRYHSTDVPLCSKRYDEFSLPLVNQAMLHPHLKHHFIYRARRDESREPRPSVAETSLQDTTLSPFVHRNLRYTSSVPATRSVSSPQYGLYENYSSEISSIPSSTDDLLSSSSQTSMSEDGSHRSILGMVQQEQLDHLNVNKSSNYINKNTKNVNKSSIYVNKNTKNINKSTNNENKKGNEYINKVQTGIRLESTDSNEYNDGTVIEHYDNSSKLHKTQLVSKVEHYDDRSELNETQVVIKVKHNDNKSELNKTQVVSKVKRYDNRSELYKTQVVSKVNKHLKRAKTFLKLKKSESDLKPVALDNSSKSKTLNASTPSIPNDTDAALAIKLVDMALEDKPRGILKSNQQVNEMQTVSHAHTFSDPLPHDLRRQCSFSPQVHVMRTWTSLEYDRRGETVTCNRLTPVLAKQIKEELNTYKTQEMKVHKDALKFTHFF